MISPHHSHPTNGVVPSNFNVICFHSFRSLGFVLLPRIIAHNKIKCNQNEYVNFYAGGVKQNLYFARVFCVLCWGCRWCRRGARRVLRGERHSKSTKGSATYFEGVCSVWVLRYSRMDIPNLALNTYLSRCTFRYPLRRDIWAIGRLVVRSWERMSSSRRFSIAFRIPKPIIWRNLRSARLRETPTLATTSLTPIGSVACVSMNLFIRATSVVIGEMNRVEPRSTMSMGGIRIFFTVCLDLRFFILLSSSAAAR